jgi:hypothetical protein
MTEFVADILLAVLEQSSKTEKAEKLASLSPEDWPAVPGEARRQGVAPLLYDRLRGLGGDLPEEITASLRQDYLKNAVRNTRLYQAFGQLIQVLKDQDIPVMALKGIHLAEAVYGNIALRPMGDLDLLVKPEDLARAGTALEKLGYKPFGIGQSIRPDKRHLVFHHPQNGLRVDLHWTLLEDRYRFRIDTEGCWARSQKLVLGEQEVRGLSPEDLLLHLCLHAAATIFALRLGMLCDLQQLINHYGEKLDWGRIVDRTRQWGAARAVTLICHLTRDLLKAPIPPEALRAIKPAAFDPGYLAQAREYILAGEHQSPPVARLREAAALTDRIAIIWGSLWIPRAELAPLYRVPVDSWRLYLYYAVRIKDLVNRHGKIVRPTVWADEAQRVLLDRENRITALRRWVTS